MFFLLVIVSIDDSTDLHNIFAGFYFALTVIVSIIDTFLYFTINYNLNISSKWKIIFIFKLVFIFFIFVGAFGMMFFVFLAKMVFDHCLTVFHCPLYFSLAAIFQHISILNMLLYILTTYSDLSQISIEFVFNKKIDPEFQEIN
jgi:hypothetical protein